MCVIIFWWRIRRERLLNFAQRDLLVIVKFLVRHTSGSKTPATNHSKIAIAVVFFTKRTAVLVYKQRQGAEKQWVFWVLHLLTFLSIRLIPGYALFTLRSLYAAVPGKEKEPQCGNKTENTITLCWEPPLNNGGKPITGYVVEIREIGSQIWGKYVTSL